MQKKKNQTKEWDWKKADEEFSLFIRHRDGRCLHPRCPNPALPIGGLTCSHYWGRGEWITRYDPDNAIALCAWCHWKKIGCWEKDKHGEYREFMIRRLGARKFNAMQRKVMKARYIYQNRSNIIKKTQAWLSRKGK
jgi:hypothetical protein